jgi:transposase InsO family protein
MTTGERRAVVTAVTRRSAISERRACRFLGFERTALRSVPQRPLRDDGVASGRRFRSFTVVDVRPRECRTITVAHRRPSVAVTAALDAGIAARGAPVRLSLDNGSEFRCQHFDDWAHRQHVARRPSVAVRGDHHQRAGRRGH